MIHPQALIDHAQRLAGSGRGRPPEADLRRGVSAAYYAVFHEITAQAAEHLIGSAADSAKFAIRRSWTHGELKAAADLVVERAKVIRRSPAAPLAKPLQEFGPLADLAAVDVHLVHALQQFSELQQLRHLADYDHAASVDKVGLLAACQRATAARTSIGLASRGSREAFFSLLTVRRKDFRERI